ncbi:glycosyltransferase [Janthinobacterium sp. LB3P118]|uniref:glycosyltransferase n=1 Tax=Janthinobacterium sp. LB3P118 TaxID=3424195 RepID=UPI003F1ECC0C
MFLKILQFVPETLPTFRADVSVLFGKYLPRHQVLCDVVGEASPDAPDLQGFRSARRPAYQRSRVRRELAYLWLSLNTLLAVKRGECDAIQVRDMVPLGWLAMLIARRKGIPFYYWVSYLMSEGRIERAQEQLQRGAGLRSRLVLWKGQLEQALLYKVVLPRAQHVFVQSDAMLAVLQAKGIAAQRMTAVPMGVDMELLGNSQPQPLRPEGWEDVPLIAYLGTLDKSRQLERVIDALAIVRATSPTACLLLIGNSPTPHDEVMLLEYVRQVGLADAVRITGWLPSAQAWQLLVAADAAVSYIPRGPLYDVSSPTKLLEYLALGMPAVGNDTPDQVHVLQSSGAGWLTASDPAALAQALNEILVDPAAARKRAATGPAFIEAQRSYRELAAMLAKRYHSLLSTPA